MSAESPMTLLELLLTLGAMFILGIILIFTKIRELGSKSEGAKVTEKA